MRVIITLIITIFFVVYVVDSSITRDEDLEKNLRERWNDDFVIVFSNIKSKKETISSNGRSPFNNKI